MGVAVADESMNIDEQALMEAAKILGTKTADETVNAALREVIAVRRRVEALERLGEMGAAGDFDEFLDKRSYRR
ncbi:type II toxin-antitoxin system VapB family antitoxin [Actinoplanes sp. NPDC049802]|uniref:type II toxin-antitoxin system VapB family antitoxin n=1 Tax=Actinoplanes sp. NPDC049802 TaxID=3154742 RepID=UPI0033FDCFF9